jgi:transposase, IS6 family
LLSSAVIMLAVRWYLRLGLSYRDVEELLAERGIEVDHVMVYAGSSGSVPLLAEPLGLACLGGGP